MPLYTFTTPYVDEGFSTNRFWRYFRQRVGVSVIKTGGIYKTARYMQDETYRSYDEYYQGGHIHTVDDTTKAALIAANIGITEANFTAQ